MSKKNQAVKLQRTIKGRNIQGEWRIYTFHLMNSKTAYRVFHEFSNKEVELAAPVIIDHLSKMWNNKDGEAIEPEEFNPDDLPLTALEIVKYFPMLLSWERISELNALMLSGAIVQIDDETIQFDKDGFADIGPVESYNALLYAIVANYEPLIPPLLLALTEQGEDDISDKSDQAAAKK